MEQITLDTTSFELTAKTPLPFPVAEPKTNAERIMRDLDAPVDLMISAGKTAEYLDGETTPHITTEALPLQQFDELISYLVDHGKIRDASLFVLQANYGMRYSDVARLRFCHLFSSDGNIKDAFTLPHGERKTGKSNIYYNNSATKLAIKSLICAERYKRKITPYDFLFCSDSSNRKYITVAEAEAMELYGYEISRVDNLMNDKRKEITAAQGKYAQGKITEVTYKSVTEDAQSDIDALTVRLAELTAKHAAYRSECPDKDKKIQSPMTIQGAIDAVKRSIKAAKIPVKKAGTHTFRKTFAEEFYRKARELKAQGTPELEALDADLLKLLQDKFMHSSGKITGVYAKLEERAFRVICSQLDLGLEALLEGTKT